MDEKKEVKKELQQELQWVQYRQKMLNIIEEKLLQIVTQTEQADQGSLTAGKQEELTARLNNIAVQVKARIQKTEEQNMEK